MGEVAAMSTEQRADDDDVVPGVAGGGFDAVLASSMLHSARIPAKTAARVVGAILRTPGPAARRLGRGLLRQLAAGLGRDEDDLPKLDRRFADPAWHGNPVLRRLAMSYLAWAAAVNDVLTGTPLDWQTRQRATLLLDNLVAAAAPTNVPLVNPASAKQAWDIGGGSLLRGLRQFLHDLQRPPRLPAFVDSSAYTIGKDLAVTPGAVVQRGEVAELIQYAPAAERVDQVPVLMVASPVNKYYLLDLGPGRSVVSALQTAGRQAFIISWINPDERQRDIGLDGYVQALLDMLEPSGTSLAVPGSTCSACAPADDQPGRGRVPRRNRPAGGSGHPEPRRRRLRPRRAGRRADGRGNRRGRRPAREPARLRRRRRHRGRVRLDPAR
jgi:polyhydroxyalkanoate synthase subunit PhaC